jgi:hypothetical protein
VRPAVAGGVRWWVAVGPPAAPGRLAGRILQTVFEHRVFNPVDTTTLAAAQGQGQRGGGGVPLFVLTGITITRDENSRIGGTRSPSTPPGGTHPGAFPLAGNSRLWEKCRFGRPGGFGS